MGRCTKAILYKDNLKYNLEQIRKYVNPESKLCVAVKADGYGHNAVLTAKLAEEVGGYDYFAVATVDEGIELRENGITEEILLLSLCIPEEFESVFKYKITPLIFGEEYISLIGKAADSYFSSKDSSASVFLAVDTGMGRIGCYPQEAGKQARLISDFKHLTQTGTITHLAVSDSVKTEHKDFTDGQFKKFMQAVESIRSEGLDPGICSCEASAGLLDHNEMTMNMARPGIITYGYYPDQITKDYLKSRNKDFDIKPVLALETQVVAIRHFTKGQSVSYGRTWIAEKDTDIGILPIGYADGLLRRFSPGLKVTINGKDYPVRGRICMDQCMIDLGPDNKDVKLFDKVLIFGPENSGAHFTADDLAKLGNTISYEILTSLTKRVKRVIQ